jgi:hypothetical protein
MSIKPMPNNSRVAGSGIGSAATIPFVPAEDAVGEKSPVTFKKF